MFPIIHKRIGGRQLATLFALVMVVLLSACSNKPLAPDASMTHAREAIATAERAGARQHAESDFDEAQQKLIQAEQAIRDEDMYKADRLARESSVVAELAVARTESAKALEINKEMRRSADALLEEMQRKGE